MAQGGEVDGVVVWGGGDSLSPSRDITDRIALTNGHLSASVTQQQIKRSEMRPSLSLWPMKR